MKTSLKLRNNKMNSMLRSAIISSFMALSMMSCTKENIEPASLSSTQESRMRSNLDTDNNAGNTFTAEKADNAQALIDIRTTAAASQPACRIIITRFATVHIIRHDELADQFHEFRLSPVKFSHLMDAIAEYNNNSQAFTADNNNTYNSNTAEAYTPSDNSVSSINTAEAYTPDNNNTFSINQVELRSCDQCDLTAVHNNGNAQERRAYKSLIDQLDRILDLNALINVQHNAGTRK